MMEIKDRYGLPIWTTAERSKELIWRELKSLIPRDARLFLEIASGTGQHALHFAERLGALNPALSYQPSDYDQEHLETLEDRVRFSRLKNLRPPIRLNAASASWPLNAADFIFNANMIQVAPFEVTEGLMRGAARLLAPGRCLVTYGPYTVDGKHASKRNQERDRSLHKMDARYGVRDIVEVKGEAEKYGLHLLEQRQMPEQNLLLIWERRKEPS
ncbi:MAG: class I SAM-dependent methyltransferase [Polyangiaceae bacterium]|nr:class I SAM-dependent methyltransferase [Polyangiaceae bacterium]